MRPRSLLALLPPVLLAASTGAVLASDLPEGYLQKTLPNGLTVSILPDPAMPVVATQVWYHVGSANEEPKTRGFAHLFEHLMFGGTASHPKEDYWDHHHKFGGENNAYTTFDETVYVSEIPPEGHQGVLALEADRMVSLSLTPENLANEKKVVTEELRLSTENSPFARLETKLLKAVFGEHPYALTPVGTKEDIAAASLDQAREFYERYYRPKNAHLVVVGPVDAAKTLAQIEKDFGPLPADGVTPPDVPPLYGWKFPEDVVRVREDIPPVEVAVYGFPLPPPDHPDHWTLEVLTELLARGNVDPFEEELVRHRRKALVAGTESVDMRRGGALAFYSAALPHRREKTAFRFMDETRAKLARFEWLDERKLAAAKRKLVLHDLDRVYHADQTANAIAEALWWQKDEHLAFETARRIERVSLDDVRSAFRKYVLDPAPVRVYMIPEHVPFYVRLFGWMVPMGGGR